MTKTMRWGVGTLSLVGLVGFGTFVGCSSDNGGDQPPVDTDSGVTPPADTNPRPDTGGGGDTGGDTAKADTTGGGDSGGGDTTDSSETPPPAPDRKVTFVFASPDTPPQFMCLGGFAGDPLAADKPTKALGPFGIPDPADPTKLKAGFGFGAVVPYPVTDPLVKAALSSLSVVAYFSDTDPSAGGSTTACSDAWAAAKTDATKYFPVPKGKVVAGTSWMLALTGCKSAPTDASGTCPATPNFAYDFQQLDLTDPATFAGDGTGAKAGLQFMHASNFPYFDGVDVYIQPMSAPTSDAGADADGGTATPAGPPIKIADNAKFGDFSAPAAGVAPKGDPDSALLVLVKHLTTPCTPGPTCLTTFYLPLDKFLAAYKAFLPGVGWTGNQALVLAGSINPADPPSSKLVIAWVPSKF